MWSAINDKLNAAFDAGLGPLSGLPWPLQVAALALPVTVVALLVFRYTSNQVAIHAVKRRIAAHLLEMRLYRDDLQVTLRAQAEVLRSSLRYLMHTLLPLAVLLLPVSLVLAQVEARYAWRPFAPGETALLRVDLAEGLRAESLPVALELPAGVLGETPVLRINRSGELYWRLRAVEPGLHRLRLRLGESVVEAELAVAGREDHAAPPRRLAPIAYRSDDPRVLAMPGARALPAGGAAAVLAITYPRAGGEFAGLSGASWLLAGLTLVMGLLLRGWLRVTF